MIIATSNFLAGSGALIKLVLVTWAPIPNLFLASGFSKKSQIGSCYLHYKLLFSVEITIRERY